MKRYLVIFDNLKASCLDGIEKVRLPRGRDVLNISILYMLVAAMLFVISAGLFMYGAVKEYRVQKDATKEKLTAVLPAAPQNIGQGILKPDVQQTTQNIAHQTTSSTDVKKAQTQKIKKETLENTAPVQKKEKYLRPLNGAILVSYGWREHPIYKDWRFHPGVNMQASSGTEVKAVLSGKVTLAERERGRWLIKMVTEAGVTIVYGNLQKSYVETGKIITQGDLIGVVGETPPEQDQGLHLEIWQGQQSVDPQTLIDL